MEDHPKHMPNVHGDAPQPRAAPPQQVGSPPQNVFSGEVRPEYAPHGGPPQEAPRPNIHVGDVTHHHQQALMPEPSGSGGFSSRSQTVAAVTVTDRRGRKITVRRLTALDRLRLFEMLGSRLADNMMYISYALSALCVSAIDGDQEHGPATKIQLESLVQRLDQDGIEAATAAHREHFEAGETADAGAVKN
jgi:hypothetical protein